MGLACVFLEWYATVGSDPAWGLSTLLSAYVSGPTSPPAAAATWRAVATLASRCQVNTQARVGPYVGHSSLNLALPEDSELRGMHVLAAAHVAVSASPSPPSPPQSIRGWRRTGSRTFVIRCTS